MFAEFTAFKTLVEGDSWFAGNVETAVRTSADGVVRANYVVLTPTRPMLDDARYLKVADSASDARHRVEWMIVAVDADGVARWFDRLDARVRGVVLTVAGRRCDPITAVPSVEGGDVRHDRDTDLFLMRGTYEFWSRRA